MQRAVGVICLVIGVLLLVWGHNASQSVGAQIQQVFTGSPPNKAMYLYAAGAVLSLTGLFQIFLAKK
ncbi:MAG TPA: DUF3185 family protein [Verrucomicrobiae bacterium]|nr:DUF3185 family protein [Verrucomicrobiae bacterium]